MILYLYSISLRRESKLRSQQRTVGLEEHASKIHWFIAVLQRNMRSFVSLDKNLLTGQFWMFFYHLMLHLNRFNCEHYLNARPDFMEKLLKSQYIINISSYTTSRSSDAERILLSLNLTRLFIHIDFSVSLLVLTNQQVL